MKQDSCLKQVFVKKMASLKVSQQQSLLKHSKQNKRCTSQSNRKTNKQKITNRNKIYFTVPVLKKKEDTAGVHNVYDATVKHDNFIKEVLCYSQVSALLFDNVQKLFC